MPEHANGMRQLLAQCIALPDLPSHGTTADYLYWCVCVLDLKSSDMLCVVGLLKDCLENDGLTLDDDQFARSIIGRTADLWAKGELPKQVAARHYANFVSAKLGSDSQGGAK